jgi:hypothetical protein
LKHRAYLKLYAFDDNGVMTDIKNIIITEDGTIRMEEAIAHPQSENVEKEKSVY